MYVQITTRCNMSCNHCCMRATPKGVDMSREVFLETMKLAEDRDWCITIGGGEPTVHPLFWDFIGIALAYTDYQHIHVITNGKLKDTAKRLARMAHSGILGADLSRDPYHDPIDYSVVKAFTKSDRFGSDSRDLRGIRTVHEIINVGRAADNQIGFVDDCACEDLFVSPDGKLWACGHQEEQFGTVFDPDLDGYFESDGCCSSRALAA